MPATTRGRHPEDLPAAEAAFRAHHRPDAITVRQDEDGWSLTCGWQHVADASLACVPPVTYTADPALQPVLDQLTAILGLFPGDVVRRLVLEPLIGRVHVEFETMDPARAEAAAAAARQSPSLP